MNQRFILNTQVPHHLPGLTPPSHSSPRTSFLDLMLPAATSSILGVSFLGTLLFKWLCFVNPGGQRQVRQSWVSERAETLAELAFYHSQILCGQRVERNRHFTISFPASTQIRETIKLTHVSCFTDRPHGAGPCCLLRTTSQGHSPVGTLSPAPFHASRF